ncbi:hypothetical protein Bca52824_074311 [Brassica carinata]|uniref:Alcohol dehydrogenase-like N-terminal domain-containing protein n=1 Tax=Brassica carinata TaxID=52824 RepID=A0A8X7TUN3_BRACI|nr:hypothetical protein Bca52824_074311 [Brassica carinata]
MMCFELRIGREELWEKEECHREKAQSLNTLKIQPFPLPSLGPHDVRVRMKAVGICGSDVHYLKTMRCADFIGHECAGVIEELLEMQPLQGRKIPSLPYARTPPVHGSLANQVVHPADMCFKLPDNVSLEEGAMCEPLSVGVHACRRAEVGPETNVLVMGDGPIGLVTMLAARAFGVPRIVIVVVDVDDNRLSVSKQLGADGIVKVTTSLEDVGFEVEQIQKLKL